MEGMEVGRYKMEYLKPNYKNVTVVITMENFGIRTDMSEREAILEALTEDLNSCSLPESSMDFEEYFSGSTVTISAI